MSTTYVALDNPFTYEIWTNTHETWTLLPEHPRLTCTFFALENFLFLVRAASQVKRTKALKQPSNQYIEIRKK